MRKLDNDPRQLSMIGSRNFPRLPYLWLGFFLYTLIVGVLIQLLLLPHVFPQWNAGQGLFLHLDSVRSHEVASEIAQMIDEQGWSAWELTPDDQGLIGIASAVYAVIVAEPWVLLPVNAALHATGTLFLYLAFCIVTESNWYSLFASIPFLVFPSALAWTSQILNDSYAVTGTVLFLYGWVAYSSRPVWLRLRRILTAIIAILTGLALVWLVRPFLLELFLVYSVFLFLIFTGIRLWSIRRDHMDWRITLVGTLLTGLTLLLLIPVASGSRRRPVALDTLPKQFVSEPLNSEADRSSVPDQTVSEPPSSEAGGSNVPDQANSEPSRSNADLWKVTNFLPNFLESRLRALSLDRRSNAKQWEGAASNIDVGIQFQSAFELIQYTPRAIQIALLAPFPAMWVGQGGDPSSSMTRMVGGFEMSIVYLILIALPYTLWHWRKSLGMWTMLSFCLGMLLVYTIATPNIGTLMRFRYAFFMPIVGLGVIGWAELIRRIRIAKKTSDAKSSAA